MADLNGQHLGQYQIISKIGSGGMATVYKAYQPSMERDVAIKVIAANLAENPDFVRRFEREAKTIAQLTHSHILRIYDYGQQDNLVYFVMELLPAGSLSDLLRKEQIPLKRIARLIDQIADALDYAHEKGIIHRDLKPQNILLDARGNAVLTDFGIAKLLYSDSTALTQTGTAMGTPSYMAPEQWKHGEHLDARTDVYALGIILYELLTGKLPYKADTPFQMMYAHLNDTPQPIRNLRSDVPAAVERVVNKALAKNREDRYQSAGELAEAFNAVITGQPVIEDKSQRQLGKAGVNPLSLSGTSPVVVSNGSQRRSPRRSNAIIAAISATILLVVLASFALLLSRNASEQESPTSAATEQAAIITSSPAQLAQVPTAINTATDLPVTPTMTSTPTTEPNTPIAPSATPNDATLIAETLIAVAIQEHQQTLDAGVANTRTAIAVASFTKTLTPTYTLTPSATNTFLPSLTSTSTPSPTFTLTPVPTSTRFPLSGRILFLSTRDSEEALYIANSDGTDARRIISPFNTDWFYRISPDVHLILFWKDMDIYVASLEGSSVQKIATINSFLSDETVFFTWSPDSKHIAYVSSGSIYIVDTDGKNTRKLLGADRSHSPSWSPDGKQIVFCNYADNVSQIYLFNLEDSSTKQLTTSPSWKGSPVWSPDGSHIAYVSSYTNGDLYMMSADGSDQRSLTTGELGVISPLWSPNGTQLAFGIGSSIYVLDIDGSTKYILTNKNLLIGSLLAWSPDGKFVAFTSEQDGNREIYVAPADGSSGPQNITNASSSEWSPVWISSNEDADNTTFQPSPTSQVSEVIAVVDKINAGSNLQFRSQPNSTGLSLGLIPSGTQVVVLGRNADGSWLYVNFNNQQGWISSAYVTVLKNGQSYPISEIQVISSLSGDNAVNTTATEVPTSLPEILCMIVVTYNSTYVRATPASNGMAITTVRFQDRLDVLRVIAGSDGRVWYFVSFKQGDATITGYILSSTVEPLTQCPSVG